jgi:hypothetical protein
MMSRDTGSCAAFLPFEDSDVDSLAARRSCIRFRRRWNLPRLEAPTWIVATDGDLWPGKALPEFFRRHRVELVCSLPCYTEEKVDQQRGKGTFTEYPRVEDFQSAGSKTGRGLS